MTGIEVVGKCAICDDRFKIRPNGRIHHHKKRGEPCEGVNWPPGALACLLPLVKSKSSQN